MNILKKFLIILVSFNFIFIDSYASTVKDKSPMFAPKVAGLYKLELENYVNNKANQRSIGIPSSPANDSQAVSNTIFLLHRLLKIIGLKNSYFSQADISSSIYYDYPGASGNIYVSPHNKQISEKMYNKKSVLAGSRETKIVPVCRQSTQAIVKNDPALLRKYGYKYDVYKYDNKFIDVLNYAKDDLLSSEPSSLDRIETDNTYYKKMYRGEAADKEYFGRGNTDFRLVSENKYKTDSIIDLLRKYAEKHNWLIWNNPGYNTLEFGFNYMLQSPKKIKKNNIVKNGYEDFFRLTVIATPLVEYGKSNYHNKNRMQQKYLGFNLQTPCFRRGYKAGYVPNPDYYREGDNSIWDEYYHEYDLGWKIK